jgi:hypothetical protein
MFLTIAKKLILLGKTKAYNMSKRRSIISYDKLSLDQKKQILKDYPDGYINHLTTIKTPNGEVLDALIWETDEIIYLVKINKIVTKSKPVIDDDEDGFDDGFDKEDEIKDDEVDDVDGEEEEDDYDKPDASDAEGEDED